LRNVGCYGWDLHETFAAFVQQSPSAPTLAAPPTTSFGFEWIELQASKPAVPEDRIIFSERDFGISPKALAIWSSDALSRTRLGSALLVKGPAGRRPDGAATSPWTDAVEFRASHSPALASGDQSRQSQRQAQQRQRCFVDVCTPLPRPLQGLDSWRCTSLQ
jgi:hypothetical protein